MSTPLENNTVTIQAILDAINNGAYSPVLQSKSVTPSASSQTITADSGYTGLSTVTVAGDSDLAATNIVSGVNIFGVTGTAGITATDDGAGNVTITMTGVSGISV